MRLPYSLTSISLRQRISVYMLFVLVIFVASGKLFGQSSYSFSYSSGTFTPISGTALTASDQDEDYFNNIPIGFGFNYWGVNYTTVSASTNGWLTFGQNISDPASGNDLMSGGTRPLVAPLWDDLRMNALNGFSYVTTGTSPNQVFTAQWLNMRWRLYATSAVISFQVKLYEATGKIEFIYLQNAGTVNTGTASIGIAAQGTGINNFLSLSGTGSAPTVSSTVETNGLNTKPASGQIYSFNPVAGASIMISSSAPAVDPGNIVQDTYENVIYAFNLSVTQANATLTGLQITTTGTYTEADISNLQAWYSSDATFNSGLDYKLSKKSVARGPGLHVFPNFLSRVIPANSTGYIFITTDLHCSSVSTKTISVNAVTASDVTFLSGSKSGSAFAGGIQTIQDAVPSNVTDASAAPDNITSLLTWTNPWDCYDEIMIVAKKGSSITSSPSGNGSAYTGNLAFGSGSAFGGETDAFVVYEGTDLPQTVTALTPGTIYYFKLFTRKGNNWSSGVEVISTTSPPAPGEYRSVGTGNWNNLSTWELFNGTTWLTPLAGEGTPTNASGKVTIRNGHTVTVSSEVTVDQVTVDAGGTILVTNIFTIANGPDAVDCQVYGTIRTWSIAASIITTGTLAFNNGSTYQHSQSGGSVPTATWNPGSTCLISYVETQIPSGLNQTFSNFTWDCPAQEEPLSLGGYPNNVTSTFALISTGFGSISPGGNVTYTNYVQNDGSIYSILGGGIARTVTVTNFTLQGGEFNMSNTGATTGTLNVSGNFTHTSGTITEDNSGSGNIVFNGTYDGVTGLQTYVSGGTISNNINITVAPGAYLLMAAEGTIITGETFTLSNGANLGITSANGISANGNNSGNIQTTTRNFGTGGNYFYRFVGPQVTGTGLPTTAITGNINVGSSTTLTTSNSIIVNGSLTVNGTFIPGIESHTIGGTGTLTGTGTVKVTRTSATADFLSQYPITNKNLANLTIDYAVSSGGQIISPFTYGNLRVSNGTGTNTIGGNVTVNGTLTKTTGTGTLTIGSGYLLTALNIINGGRIIVDATGKATVGNFANNGTLRLNSTSPTQYSSLIVDTYSGTGSANVQLFLTGGGAAPNYNWHYVAVPYDGLSTTYFTNVNPLNLRAYNDVRVVSSEFNGWSWWDGYGGYPGIAAGGGFTSMNFGQGYLFYHTTDATINFNGLPSIGTTLGNNGVFALQYSGPAPNSPIHGLNLLGNSLTCSLDWDKVSFSGSVDQAVYYTTGNKWATYLKGAGGTNGGTKDIPPLQGFIVKASATGASINVAAARQHTTQARYKKSALTSESEEKVEAVYPKLKLELNGAETSDETIIWFNDEATTGFDSQYDAKKMFSSEAAQSQVYSILSGSEFVINGMPTPHETDILPLGIKIAQTGTYTFYKTDFVNPDNFDIILVDKANNNHEVDLKNNDLYTFDSEAGTFTNRFVLKFSATMTGVDDPIISSKDFNVYATDKFINIMPLNSQADGSKGKVTIYNLTGRKLKQVMNIVWYKGNLIQIPCTEQRMVLVEFTSGLGRYTEKVVLK